MRRKQYAAIQHTFSFIVQRQIACQFEFHMISMNVSYPLFLHG